MDELVIALACVLSLVIGMFIGQFLGGRRPQLGARQIAQSFERARASDFVGSIEQVPNVVCLADRRRRLGAPL